MACRLPRVWDEVAEGEKILETSEPLGSADISCVAGSGEGALGSVVALMKGTDLMQFKQQRLLFFSSLI